MNVLLIGHGAIAQEVLKRLGPEEPARVTAVLVRDRRLAETRAALPDAIEVVTALDDLRTPPGLAAECAGHAGVSEHGADILRRGIDLIVISIGALADRAGGAASSVDSAGRGAPPLFSRPSVVVGLHESPP